MDIFLLGCGEMGRVCAIDLAQTYTGGKIILADRSLKKANDLAKELNKKNISVEYGDANNSTGLAKVIRKHNAGIILNATNYYFNLKVMKAALLANANYLDLGGLFHVTKKQLKMNPKFKEKRLLAVLGCGSSPGITNIMVDYAARKLDRINSIEISFADKDYTKYDLPIVIPYSIQTLFDECSSHPIVFSGGKFKSVEPFSGHKEIIFPQPVGVKDCFYTLHSEVESLPRSFKGLKHSDFRGGFDPQLVSAIKFLTKIGFASDKKIKLNNGSLVSPREVITKITEQFIPNKKTKINDVEFLKVELDGTSNKKKTKIEIFCKAMTNKKWNVPAGSWDTGAALSAFGQIIASEKVEKKGAYPPEEVIRPEILFYELKKRNIKIYDERYKVYNYKLMSPFIS